MQAPTSPQSDHGGLATSNSRLEGRADARVAPRIQELTYTSVSKAAAARSLDHLAAREQSRGTTWIGVM